MATAVAETPVQQIAPAKAVVLYDGDCPLCQRGVRILRKLDWLKKLQYQNCRETANLPKSDTPLDPQKMIEEMHVVTPGGKRVYVGFNAFRWMAWRFPLTVLSAPFFYLPGVPWLGRKAYLWLARNRFKLVPCHDGQCKVNLGAKK